MHHSLRSSLESGQVKFIVLDSVAAMFRTDYSGGTNPNGSASEAPDFGERSQELLRMAAQLKQFSAIYHVPILVINQVSDFFAGSDSNQGQPLRIEQMKHS